MFKVGDRVIVITSAWDDSRFIQQGKTGTVTGTVIDAIFYKKDGGWVSGLFGFSCWNAMIGESLRDVGHAALGHPALVVHVRQGLERRFEAGLATVALAIDPDRDGMPAHRGVFEVGQLLAVPVQLPHHSTFGACVRDELVDRWSHESFDPRNVFKHLGNLPIGKVEKVRHPAPNPWRPHYVGNGLTCGVLRVGRSSDRDQQIPESRGRSNSRRTVPTATTSANFAKALGALQAHPCNNGGVKPRFAFAPIQFWKFAADRVEPRRLARIVAVPALLNAACPSPMEVRGNPSTFPRRLVQAEVSPCVAAARMLQDSTVSPDSGQRSLEAATVVTLCLALAGELDVERLAGPELPPTLAGRMGNHRKRAGVCAGIPDGVPWINPVNPEVAAVSLNEKRGNHINPFPHDNPSQTRSVHVRSQHDNPRSRLV